MDKALFFFFAVYLLIGVIALTVLFFHYLFRRKKLKKAHIAVVDVDGIIVNDQKGSGKFSKFMREVALVRTLGIKALVLRINSPGGTIVASERMYHALADLRKDGVKVVALLEDVAASGGFYIAMAADKIVASEGTITGSIGVILQNFNIAALLETFGIKAETVKSGKFKDSLSRTRELTDEDRNALREVVLDMHEHFCSVVARSRGIPLDDVKKLESRIVTGRQAKELKLVDELGRYEDAVRIAKEISGVGGDEAVVAHLSRPMGRVARTKVGSVFEEALFRAKHPGTPLWFFVRF